MYGTRLPVLMAVSDFLKYRSPHDRNVEKCLILFGKCERFNIRKDPESEFSWSHRRGRILTIRTTRIS